MKKFLIGSLLMLQAGALYAPDRSVRGIAAATASTIVLRQTIPSKIFTPNGDGVNDLFTIILENPNGSVMSQKKIYNLSGFEVSDLTVVGDETASTVVLTWNGRDNDGNEVKSGIYVYQLQSEGESINGTVVVAR